MEVTWPCLDMAPVLVTSKHGGRGLVSLNFWTIFPVFPVWRHFNTLKMDYDENLSDEEHEVPNWFASNHCICFQFNINLGTAHFWKKVFLVSFSIVTRYKPGIIKRPIITNTAWKSEFHIVVEVWWNKRKRFPWLVHALVNWVGAGREERSRLLYS